MTVSEKEQRVLFLLKRAIRLNPCAPQIAEALATLQQSANAAIVNEALILKSKVP